MSDEPTKKKELRNAVAELRDTVETRLDDEREKYDEALSDTQEKVDRINKKINQLETNINRREIDGGEPEKTEAMEVFGKFLKRESLTKDDAETMKEAAAMGEWYDTKDITVGTSGNQSDAIAPEEFVREIIKDAVEISPVRQVARVRSTDRRQVKIPVLQGRPTAQYVSEQGTRATCS